MERNVGDGVKERVEEVVVEWNLTDVKWKFLLRILLNRSYIYLFTAIHHFNNVLNITHIGHDRNLIRLLIHCRNHKITTNNY